MQEDKTQGKSGQEEPVAGIVLISRPLKMRFSKPKLSFLYYPLSSINYFENYSQANHKHFNGLYSDDMSPAHASTKTKKRENQRNSFPHKAQDKINPIYIFKAKMSVFLAFVCFFCYYTSIEYRDSSTLSMTENSTVVQNKIVNSNFYSYTICRIELK